MKVLNHVFGTVRSFCFARPSLFVGLALVAVLMFVWPIPHTISLRYLLVVPALAIFGCRCARERRDFWRREFNLPALILGAFVLWMVFIAVARSSETAWSLGEIEGQWVMPLVTCYLGLLMGPDIYRAPRRDLLLTLVVLLPLVVHVVAVDVVGMHDLLTGRNERVSGLVERPDISSYLTNIAFALLLAETFARSRARRSLFAFGNFTLAALWVAAAFSVVFAQIRNGVFVLAVLVVVWTLALFGDLRRSGSALRGRGLVVVGALLLAAGLIAGSESVKSGSSWAQTIATVSIAWDTKAHREWLHPDRPLPKLPDGSPVGLSAYLRVAWFKEGAILVAEHPLGVGYGRNVFGHQIRAKYGVDFSYHSHSSALDLAIGTGIPGLLFWFGFLGAATTVAWRRMRAGRGGYELALVLIVVDFGARSLVDSNVRDHMLQQFMFLVGLMLSLLVVDTEAPEKSAVTVTGRNDTSSPCSHRTKSDEE